MPLIGAEAAAASAVIFLASAVVSAYLADWVGFRIAPFAILAVSLVATAAAALRLRARAAADHPALFVFLAVVCLTFAGLAGLAWPMLLPPGSGPDLAHHLALVDYIERHWRLVHDVRLSEYLGEMIDYTPGFHLLAALVGVWAPGDALHVVYAVVSATVALKAGFVFLVARRLVPPGAPRDPFALAAVLLLLLPSPFSIGSFTEQSYLAQVASELFAVAMWWAIVVWDESEQRWALALFALLGAAGFLVWPVWIGPLGLTLAAVALTRQRPTLRERLKFIACAGAPIVAIALMHAWSHPGGLRIVGTGGFAIRPSRQTVGATFLAVSVVGLVTAARCRRTRTAVVLTAAIAAQSAALAVAARRSGAAAPYLAIKMFYLAIYPMAVAGAALLADMWQAAVRRLPRLQSSAAAWSAVAIVGAASAWPVVAAPRPRPVVTEPVLRAAEWTRARTAPECIDYLTRDAYTAYWLHIAVFANARASGRAMDDDTFEPKKALVRWILPDGLPYAITDDFDALPRDIRNDVDVVARFPPAAVVKRRGAAPCP